MVRVINSAAMAATFDIAGDANAPGVVNSGSVTLRGVAVALDADVGQAFIVDCCRNTEACCVMTI